LAGGWFEIPQRAEEYVLFSEFRADPERHKLATPSGRIELFSERIARFGYDDCPPHPTWLEPAERLGARSVQTYPLHLISSQPRYRLHSQMDPGPVSAQGKVAGREAVAISPADAKWRGIADGDVVRVYNGRGACLAGAVVTDAVSEGVLRLSCGAWYDPAGSDDDAICLHGNANVLTRDHGTSKLSQGPSCATTLVEIERFTGMVPPVRAFVPPIWAPAMSPRRSATVEPKTLLEIGWIHQSREGDRPSEDDIAKAKLGRQGIPISPTSMSFATLQLTDQTDAVRQILAERIIALAKQGVVDPNLLCQWALDDLRKSPPSV
jgi:Molydopterin dinucleotide binding domain